MTNNIDPLDVFVRGAKEYRSAHGMNDTAGMIVSPASLGAGAEAVAKAAREEVNETLMADNAALRQFIAEIAPWTSGETWHARDGHRTPALEAALRRGGSA